MSSSVPSGGRVTVYGSNIMRPPLCDDSDAQIVVVRSVTGEPVLVLARLAGDNWGLSMPDDADWAETCVRLGLMKPGRAADVLAKAISSTGSH